MKSHCPVTLFVVAASPDELTTALQSLHGNLTATIHAEANELDEAKPYLDLLREKVGRILWNGFPTGVEVVFAQMHGGPYPATSHSGFTAVGMPAAIRRFAALHSYDQVPSRLLPEDLRDANPRGFQRLVDGVWTTANVTAGETS